MRAPAWVGAMDVECVGCRALDATGATFQACAHCERHLCDWCKPPTMGFSGAGPAPKNPALGFCSDACFRAARPRTWEILNKAAVQAASEEEEEPPLCVGPSVPWWSIVGNFIAAGR